MTRASLLELSSALLPFVLALGCVNSRATSSIAAPTLTPVASAIPEPELALPFHSAPIVDVVMLAPGPGERWRMLSGDLDGWLRFWADGKLLAASHAHPGGLAGLVRATDGTVYTAGFDGRVREWAPSATVPTRTFRFAEQVTALAVSDQHLALSDGRTVQLWTRTDPPELAWTSRSNAFVTGLALSLNGGVIAAAELRESGMRDAIATHPLANPQGEGLRAVDPNRAAELAYLAARDFPGAAADLVEVWQWDNDRSRELVPQAPIDADLGLFPPGGVVYREIFGREHAAVIGRRLEDKAHVSLSLVKPWALFSGASESSQEQQPLPDVGDFVVGPNGEILVVDHFPGWAGVPPEWGWRVGEERELAIGFGFAALGDGHGNLAVVDLAQPTEAGWQAPGEERPDLLAVAPNQAWFATATLEPRTQYRLWSLADATQRPIRVEDPASILDLEQATKYSVTAAPMYPVTLALDDQGQTLAVSLASFGDPTLSAVRLLQTRDGVAQLLTVATQPNPLELALSPDGRELLAWTAGFEGFGWTSVGVQWTASDITRPIGAPLISSNGRFTAHVSGSERTLVDRSAGTALVIAKVDPIISEAGSPIPAALANDGTLALVDPFGGGIVQLLLVDGTQVAIDLPGSATALAWVEGRDAVPVLVVGFQDGSIVRVDRASASTAPIHAGEGGRVWSLAQVGGRPGVFLELDERGLALHRLDDDAVINVHLGDATTLARHRDSSPQGPSGTGLVAVWRPGAAMPICAVLDGSQAGVITSVGVRELDSSEGPAFFEAFTSGGQCPTQPKAATIEPVPLVLPTG